MKFEYGAEQDADRLKAFAEELEWLLHTYGFRIFCSQDFAALQKSEVKSELVIGGTRVPDLWTINYD